MTYCQLVSQVSSAIKAKAVDSRKYDKFLVSYNELDKVTQLLLMLSSRLSRIDNSTSKLIRSAANDSRMVSIVIEKCALFIYCQTQFPLAWPTSGRPPLLLLSFISHLEIAINHQILINTSANQRNKRKYHLVVNNEEQHQLLPPPLIKITSNKPVFYPTIHQLLLY